MGAGASSMASLDGDGVCRTGLGDLPEACVASVLFHLDPPEICRMALVNRDFRRAAAAEFVWESKLPNNYEYLMDKITEEKDGEEHHHRRRRGKRLGKKEIYASLCHPNPFDGGTKIFWLEKHTGGICMSISSKALSITGIDDRRYWNYVPTEESRFHTVAYLQQIWWFEVDGEIEFCFPTGAYSLFFRLQLGHSSRRLWRRVCNREHIHGWDIKPVRFRLSTSDGQCTQTECFLDEPGNWIHYQVGEFVVENSDVPTKVKFSMTQIDCTHTKGGLCVDSVLIFPSGFRPEKAFVNHR